LVINYILLIFNYFLDLLNFYFFPTITGVFLYPVEQVRLALRY